MIFQSLVSKGGSRSPAKSNMEIFVTVVDGFLDSCQGGVTSCLMFASLMLYEPFCGQSFTYIET